MPECPKCGMELRTIYPLDSETLKAIYPLKDFLMCPKCKIAYDPKTLISIAHII
jgi:uncharacterized protein with PIN domain